MWLGVILLGVSVVLIGRALLRSRGRGSRARAVAVRRAAGARPPKAARGAPAIDDDMAEIEAILRKRGIS